MSRRPMKVTDRKGKTRSRTRDAAKIARLEMACYRCEICGRMIDTSCALHHLLPPGAEGRNKAENVMVLCSSCHHELERRPHYHGIRHLEDTTRYDG